MRGHAIQQRPNDVVLQYRAELDLLLALHDVEQRGAARDLNVFDADVLVHRDQHRSQCAVDLRAVLEAQQVIQVVEHLREHLMSILVHDGGQEDLILVGIASYRVRWNIVSAAGGVGGVVESQELKRPLHTALQARDVRAVRSALRFLLCNSSASSESLKFN